MCKELLMVTCICEHTYGFSYWETEYIHSSLDLSLPHDLLWAIEYGRNDKTLMSSNCFHFCSLEPWSYHVNSSKYSARIEGLENLNDVRREAERETERQREKPAPSHSSHSNRDRKQVNETFLDTQSQISPVNITWNTDTQSRLSLAHIADS